ncbi:MAG: S8 family serine peptidase [Chthoniobacterales bacterium]
MKKPCLKFLIFTCLIFDSFLINGYAQTPEQPPLTSILLPVRASAITASDYSDFLNQFATESDPNHLYNQAMASDPTTACIVRLGEPGRWHYQVIVGRENCPIYYINRLQAEASFAGRLGEMNSEISSSVTSTSNFNSHIEDVSRLKEEANDDYLSCNSETFEVEVPSTMLTLLSSSTTSTSTSNFDSYIEDVSAAVGILGLMALGHEMVTLQDFRQAVETHPPEQRLIITGEGETATIQPQSQNSQNSVGNRSENLATVEQLAATLQSEYPEVNVQGIVDEHLPKGGGIIRSRPDLTAAKLQEILHRVDEARRNSEVNLRGDRHSNEAFRSSDPMLQARHFDDRLSLFHGLLQAMEYRDIQTPEESEEVAQWKTAANSAFTAYSSLVEVSNTEEPKKLQEERKIKNLTQQKEIFTSIVNHPSAKRTTADKESWKNATYGGAFLAHRYFTEAIKKRNQGALTVAEKLERAAHKSQEKVGYHLNAILARANGRIADAESYDNAGHGAYYASERLAKSIQAEAAQKFEEATQWKEAASESQKKIDYHLEAIEARANGEVDNAVSYDNAGYSSRRTSDYLAKVTEAIAAQKPQEIIAVWKKAAEESRRSVEFHIQAIQARAEGRKKDAGNFTDAAVGASYNSDRLEKAAQARVAEELKEATDWENVAEWRDKRRDYNMKAVEARSKKDEDNDESRAWTEAAAKVRLISIARSNIIQAKSDEIREAWEKASKEMESSLDSHVEATKARAGGKKDDASKLSVAARSSHRVYDLLVDIAKDLDNTAKALRNNNTKLADFFSKSAEFQKREINDIRELFTRREMAQNEADSSEDESKMYIRFRATALYYQKAFESLNEAITKEAEGEEEAWPLYHSAYQQYKNAANNFDLSAKLLGGQDKNQISQENETIFNETANYAVSSGLYFTKAAECALKLSKLSNSGRAKTNEFNVFLRYYLKAKLIEHAANLSARAEEEEARRSTSLEKEKLKELRDCAKKFISRSDIVINGSKILDSEGEGFLDIPDNLMTEWMASMHDLRIGSFENIFGYIKDKIESESINRENNVSDESENVDQTLISRLLESSKAYAHDVENFREDKEGALASMASFVANAKEAAATSWREVIEKEKSPQGDPSELEKLREQADKRTRYANEIDEKYKSIRRDIEEFSRKAPIFLLKDTYIQKQEDPSLTEEQKKEWANLSNLTDRILIKFDQLTGFEEIMDDIEKLNFFEELINSLDNTLYLVSEASGCIDKQNMKAAEKFQQAVQARLEIANLSFDGSNRLSELQARAKSQTKEATNLKDGLVSAYNQDVSPAMIPSHSPYDLGELSPEKEPSGLKSNQHVTREIVISAIEQLENEAPTEAKTESITEANKEAALSLWKKALSEVDNLDERKKELDELDELALLDESSEEKRYHDLRTAINFIEQTADSLASAASAASAITDGNQELSRLYEQVSKHTRIASDYYAKAASLQKVPGSEKKAERYRKAGESAQEAVHQFSQVIEYANQAAEAGAADNEEVANMQMQVIKQLEIAGDYYVNAAQSRSQGREAKAKEWDESAESAKQVAGSFIEAIKKTKDLESDHTPEASENRRYNSVIELQNQVYRVEKGASDTFIQALYDPSNSEKKEEVLQSAHAAKEAWDKIVEQMEVALHKPSRQVSDKFQEWWAQELKQAKEKQVFWDEAIRLHNSKENLPSNNDLREFPYARIVDQEPKNVLESGRGTKKRILKTICHYPYVLIEEEVGSSSGIEQEADATTRPILNHREMVADHLIVTLEKDENPKDFLQKLNNRLAEFPFNMKLQMSIEESIPSFNSYRLSFRPVADLSNEVKEPTIAAFNAVLEATKYLTVSREPNFLAHLCATGKDKYYDSQWHLHHELAGIRAPEAWNIEDIRDKWARNITLAVIDTGMATRHEDLVNNMWSRTGSELQRSTNYPTDLLVSTNSYHGYNALNKNFTPTDIDGHGTHVGGIAGAETDNVIGVASVARKVQLMACKAGKLGKLPAEARAQCIKFASDNKAKILNCSYSSTGYSEEEFKVLKDAQNKGIIAVVAAGNREPNDPDLPQGYFKVNGFKDPSNYFNNDFYPCYPANYGLDNIITVAASSTNNELSLISYYGPESVHIAAPGENIFSTLCNVDDPYASKDGTSMAVPQVSGALALIMAKFSHGIYYKWINRLLKTTDELTPDSRRLHQKIRFGRLNLAKALSVDREYRTHNINKLNDINELITIATQLKQDPENAQLGIEVQQKAEKAYEYFNKAIKAFQEAKEEEGDSWDNAFENALFAAQQLREKIELLGNNQQRNTPEVGDAGRPSEGAQEASHYFAKAAEAFADERWDDGERYDRAGMLAQSAARHYAQRLEPMPKGFSEEKFHERKKCLLSIAIAEQDASKQFIQAINYQHQAEREINSEIKNNLSQAAGKSKLAGDYFTNAAQAYMAGRDKTGTNWDSAALALVKTAEYTAGGHVQAAEESKRASDFFIKAVDAFANGKEKVGGSCYKAGLNTLDRSELLSELDRSELLSELDRSELLSELDHSERLSELNNLDPKNRRALKQMSAQDYATASEHFSSAAVVYERGDSEKGDQFYRDGEAAAERAREANNPKNGNGSL